MLKLTWFSKRKNIVQKLNLIELRDKLLTIKSSLYIVDLLDNVVLFYSIVSPWYDRITEFDHALENIGEREPQKAHLKKLWNLIWLHGRDPYWINRTRLEEPITEEKIFLGNIFGLFTKSVSFWKERVGVGDQEVDVIIALQCNTILQDKESIIEVINSLQDQ